MLTPDSLLYGKIPYKCPRVQLELDAVSDRSDGRLALAEWLSRFDASDPLNSVNSAGDREWAVLVHLGILDDLGVTGVPDEKIPLP